MSYNVVRSTDEGWDRIREGFTVVEVLISVFFFLSTVIRLDDKSEWGHGFATDLQWVLGLVFAVSALWHYWIASIDGKQQVADFGNGLVAMKRGEFWGLFDSNTQDFVLQFKYDRIQFYDWKREYLIVEIGDRMGLFSLKEKRFGIRLQPLTSIWQISSDLWGSKRPNGLCGAHSFSLGKIVVKHCHRYVSGWSETNSFVSVEDESGMLALFSIDDKRLVTQYDGNRIERMADGVFKLQIGHKKRRSQNPNLRYRLYFHQPRLYVQDQYKLVEWADLKKRYLKVRDDEGYAIRLIDGVYGKDVPHTGQLDEYPAMAI